MLRLLPAGLLAVALPALQSGCCCCRLPAAMLRFGAANAINNQQPIVVQPPPVVVNPPNFKEMQPVKDIGKDFQPPKDFGKDFPIPKDFAKDFPVPKDFGKDMGNPFGNQKEYVYSIRTGQLKLGNQVIGTGYSGRGPARNNAAFTNQAKQGPIPAGDWRIAIRTKDFKTGEPIIHLHPMGSHGRPGEFFTIGPDSNPPGNAGESGIVMPRDVRDRIDVGQSFNRLKVIP